MKILITGNLGFVGTETQNLLVKEGHQVLGYDLMSGCDIKDLQQFEATILAHRPDRVLHLAAIARFADADKNPRMAFETNVIGTMNVSNVCKKYHVPLVYASTGSVYMPIKQNPPITEEFRGMGNSVYGCSKFAGETYVQA